mmetsp:Transcript_202/g.541  ORF Transcript_202/g.541 Transcript_202/m.541 type:complete len:251 (-) Transcript_202:582-1334(-)
MPQHTSCRGAALTPQVQCVPAATDPQLAAVGAAGAGSARPASVAAGTEDSPARLEPQHVRRLPTEDTPHVCWNPADNVSHDVLTAHGGSATWPEALQPRHCAVPSPRRTAHTQSSPADTAAHGPNHAPLICGTNPPQQRTARSVAPTPQLKRLPQLTAIQSPPIEGGSGETWPWSLHPQHLSAPVRSMPHVWQPPLEAATERQPFGLNGGVLCPCESSPQQWTLSAASMAQVCRLPALMVCDSAATPAGQ